MEQEDGTVQIPVEDIEIILCIGAKIRFSTMGLGELNKAGVIVVGFGKKHEPETIIEPYFPNQRHSSFLKLQINKYDLPFSEGDTPHRPLELIGFKIIDFRLIWSYTSN